MTRPIKFRAWNKIPKVMSTTQFGMTSNSLSETKDTILMQFTGLLDKNGKEIYEGDVIRFEEPRFESEMRNGEVKMIEGAYGIESKEQFDSFVDFLDKGDWSYEIIGNIHENPELISVK